MTTNDKHDELEWDYVELESKYHKAITDLEFYKAEEKKYRLKCRKYERWFFNIASILFLCLIIWNIWLILH